MKKQVINLMVSAAIFTTSPLFAMEEEGTLINKATALKILAEEKTRTLIEEAIKSKILAEEKNGTLIRKTTVSKKAKGFLGAGGWIQLVHSQERANCEAGNYGRTEYAYFGAVPNDKPRTSAAGWRPVIDKMAIKFKLQISLGGGASFIEDGDELRSFVEYELKRGCVYDVKVKKFTRVAFDNFKAPELREQYDSIKIVLKRIETEKRKVVNSDGEVETNKTVKKVVQKPLS